MGDVLGITEANGNLIAQYVYDDWGKLVSIDTADEETSTAYREIAEANPLRYRGYYYDNETGYYYLQSRYYDPEICRFINADDIDFVNEDSILGINIFAYCANNPVNNVDYTGNAYNASRAKKYAENWWDDINIRYGRNKDGDCANFVSQCLFAGGLSVMTGISKWGWHCYMSTSKSSYLRATFYYERSHAWAAAQNLYDWLHSSKHTTKKNTYILKTASDVDKIGKILYSKPTCAAAIFFSWKKDGKIGHAAISGEVIKYKNIYDVYYYAHSENRNGKRYYGKTRKYYSLKDFLKGSNGKKRIYVCILK